jgi:ribose 1,5-bisphosphate isomerase
MKQLLETAQKIKSMEIRGAGKIARTAAAQLRDYSERQNIRDILQFNDKMKIAA